MSENEPGHISAQVAHSGNLSRDLARHSFTARMARGRRTICVGRDPGDLAAHVTRTARHVIAVYVSIEGMQPTGHCRANSRLSFACGDWHRLPFLERSVDLVVSFDMSQSLDEWELFVAEARRVLTDPGLLITSPPGSDDQRRDSHAADLADCPWYSRLIHYFFHTRVIAQAHSDAIIFSLPEVTEAELFVECGAFGPSRQSLIALCSGVPVLSSPPIIYIPEPGNVLREREKHIRLVQAELNQKTEWLREAENQIALARQAYQAVKSECAQDIERARHAIDVLEQENLAKTSWCQDLDTEIQSLHGIVTALQKDLAEQTECNHTLTAERNEILAKYQALETETIELRTHLQICLDQLHLTEVQLSERTQWAHGLERQIQTLTADLNALFGSLAYRIGKRIGLSPVPPSDPRARR